MPQVKMPEAKLTTQVGEASYPHIHAKDTRFSKKPDGSDAFYKCGIILKGAAAKEVLKTARRLIKEAHDRGLASDPEKLPGEWDKESQTLNLKTKSSFKPAVFDAAGNPVSDIMLGSGSKVRLALNLVVYEGFGATGVTPYINAVQVIDLVEGGGGSADAFGFDATEGFTADEESFDSFSEDTPDTDDEDIDGADF